LDGNCRDFTLNAEREENRNNADSAQERLLIDSIVESVCSCRGEKNENVQVQLIKVSLKRTLRIIIFASGLADSHDKLNL